MEKPEPLTNLPTLNSYAQSILLRKIWEELGRRYPPASGQTLLVYGAGKFTKRLLKQIMPLTQGPILAGIVDDQAKAGQTLAGHRVMKPGEIAHNRFSAVLLGTDSFEDQFARQCIAVYGPACTILRYSCLGTDILAFEQAHKNTDRPESLFQPSQGDPFLDIRTLWQIARSLSVRSECNDFKDNLLLAIAINIKPANTERMTEYGFALRHLAQAEGRVLDIGSRNSLFPGVLADKGFHVTCLEPDQQPSKDARIQILRGDARKTDFPDSQYDFITCISTLEHIGLPGRYGITEEDPDGELNAMREMYRLLKPGGRLILTVPFGQYAMLPLNRVYTREKIMTLKGAFQCVEEEYFCIEKDGSYRPATAQEASESDLRVDGYYALGCYLFKREVAQEPS